MNKEQLKAIHDRHFKCIYYYCRKMVNNDHIAQEITVEAFLLFFRSTPIPDRDNEARSILFAHAAAACKVYFIDTFGFDRDQKEYEFARMGAVIIESLWESNWQECRDKTKTNDHDH